MIARILITLGVMIFAVVVPALEINSSHVFNSEWPPHARFHEVWQLTTNCGVGVLCLWLAWAKNNIKLASTLVIIVMGGALLSHGIENLYGGSIVSGNISKTFLGLELAAAAACIAILMAISAVLLEGKHKSPAKS
ncbi:hypothetical protein [Pseudomonas sp.]|uniref:hypothetical protein n=1 Tax=Pseudomonas sp. TaxID=306 RepID=UPI002C434540|nr:hypothetical protein [Pseudomonas sp.]HUE92226.1 hypothetical protein [Pseudomonas sp.]